MEDKSAAIETVRREKATADPGSIGSPLSAAVVEVRVHDGQEIKAGDPYVHSTSLLYCMSARSMGVPPFKQTPLLPRRTVYRASLTRTDISQGCRPFSDEDGTDRLIACIWKGVAHRRTRGRLVSAVAGKFEVGTRFGLRMRKVQLAHDGFTDSNLGRALRRLAQGDLICVVTHA